MLPSFSVGGEHNHLTWVSGLAICHDNGWSDYFPAESSGDFKLNPNITAVQVGTDSCFFSTSIDAFCSYFCPAILSFSNNFGFLTSSKCSFGSPIRTPTHITISSIWIIGSFFSFCCSSFFKAFFVYFCRLEGFQRLDFDGNHIARHNFLGVGRADLKCKFAI